MLIEKYWKEKPLTVILFAAIFFRMIAVLFSKGYGMSDDHFLVIEPAQSWLDGSDNSNWIPTAANKIVSPSGHSLLYPGLHYLLFRFLQFFGMFDPQAKMYIVRLLHAAWSMIIVYTGYKIALRLSGLAAAKIAGGLLAILFFMPMMSVRNLVEFACIPPLIYATWLCIKNDENSNALPFITAGLMLSLAFSIRFQTALFIGGFAPALLLKRKWKETLFVGIGLIAGLIVVQSATDMFIWHKPFMEFKEYVRYNIENANNYGRLEWYTYLLLISGILIPPISIFLLYGFCRNWRKHLILFLPAFIFFVFHSSFPNKQERFILPVIPFIIISGAIGWCDYIVRSAFWQSHQKLYRSCWIFFFCLNTIPLVFISATYSHRNRVEAMIYLSKKKDFNNFLIEESNRDSYTLPPLFYLKKWVTNFYVTGTFPVDSLVKRIREAPPDELPNYVVFNHPENLNKRIQNLKKVYPHLVYETTIEPSLVDKVMYFLNNHNDNATSYIYKIGKN